MKLRPVFVLFALAFTSSITHAQQTQAPRPVGVDDLFGVREVHDPQIPDRASDRLHR